MRLLACWLLAAGCGGGPAAVELGTGGDHFVALRDGDAVPVIHGLQGGYHLWGSVRASNLAPQNLTLRFRLARLDDPTPVAVRSDVVDLTDGEHLGSAVFLPDPEVVRGRACRLRLDATDESGRSASSERVITPE